MTNPNVEVGYNDSIEEYIKQDERLQEPEVKNEIFANNKGLTFPRLMKIGRGVREIHYTKIFGEDIPLRLISRDEETKLQHQCVVEMAKEFPEFKGALYNINFEKMYLKKQLSLATSVCIEAPNYKRYLTEEEVGSLPSSTMAALITEYQRLEKEYNPVINDIDDDQVNFLIGRLLDPEKKSITMNGLTFAQMKKTFSKFLDIHIALQDDTSITDSLISTS